MRNFFSVLIFILFFSHNVSSQKIEVGISPGASLFKGDVNPNFSFKESKPAIAGFVRYYISTKFTIRPSLLFTTLTGDDYKNESFNNKDIWKKFRNLSFRSRIVELNVCAEYSLKDLLKKKSSPYAFAGIGLFYFNPQAEFEGKWHNLKPLSTEGQDIPGYKKGYKRLQPTALLGIGWKFKISPRISTGIEVGIRFTRTDYIDDVSGNYINANTLQAHKGFVAAALSNRAGTADPTVPYPGGNYGVEGTARGNPNNYDKYIICNFTLSYRFFSVITPKMYK